MWSRMAQCLLAAGALALIGLSTTPAAAQSSRRAVRPRYVEPGPYLRYGLLAEGGGLFVPDVVSLGIFGIQGQVGVQLDERVGIHVDPSFDFVRGRARGLHLGGALMVDFTFDDVVTLGVGPDVATFAALGRAGLAGGALFGVRLHMSVQPVVVIAPGAIRREAFTIGFDLRLYTGGGGGLVTPRHIVSSDFVAAPILTFGYKSF